MNEKLAYFIDLTAELTKKELKVRYKSSILGYLWSILNPLSLALVFFFAFKLVMRIQVQDYALFLISGLFAWQWLTNSVSLSTSVYLNNASLIKKVNFNREILPLTVVLNDLIHFIISIPIIMIFTIIFHHKITPVLIYGLPLIMLSQFLMVYGMALAVASINLFFRDLERLVSVFLLLAFYLTPVIYPDSFIPEQYRAYIYFNPFAPLMIFYHNLFLNGQFSALEWEISTAYGLLFLAIGYFIFDRLKWKFAEVL